MTDFEHEHAEDFVILTDEEGGEYEFEVTDVIEIDGNSYAILYPVDEEAEDDGYVIMRLAVDEEGEEILEDIEDDDEWERVVAAWEEFLDADDLEDEDEDIDL